MQKGIIYLTDGELPERYSKPCLDALLKIVEDGGYELVSSSRQPINVGENVVTEGPKGYENYFKQILAGLEALTAETVFIAEHDVIYPKEHFEFNPPDDSVYYDINWWKVFPDEDFAISWEADQVSGICAPRAFMLEWYRNKVATFNTDLFDRKFEPLSGEGAKQWKASRPHIDIRHGRNLTFSKRGLHHFRKKETAVNLRESTLDNIPGWTSLKETLSVQ